MQSEVKSRGRLSIPEAAEYLGVKPSTIRQWVWRRKIDVVRVGRCVRIPMEACDRIIERGTLPALEETLTGRTGWPQG